MKVTFSYDSSHTSWWESNGEEQWYGEFDVELTDDEFDRLKNAYIKFDEKEIDIVRQNNPDVVIDEYFMHNYLPDIFDKVKEALKVRAVEIFGEEVLADVGQFDIVRGCELLDLIYPDGIPWW